MPIKLIYKLKLLTYLVIALLLTGCASQGFKPSSGEGLPAVAIEQIRGPLPAGMATITKNIVRANYQKALAKEGAVNSARLVEIYQRGKSNDQLKEYRLLDVRPGSAYNMLGLEHADIIIATDGYVVPVPRMFWNYLNLIAQFEEGNIEIRRNDQPVMVKFRFIG